MQNLKKQDLNKQLNSLVHSKYRRLIFQSETAYIGNLYKCLLENGFI